MEITGVGVLRSSTSSTVKPMPALHFTIIKKTYVPSFIAILASTMKYEIRTSYRGFPLTLIPFDTRARVTVRYEHRFSNFVKFHSLLGRFFKSPQVAGPSIKLFIGLDCFCINELDTKKSSCLGMG